MAGNAGPEDGQGGREIVGADDPVTTPEHSREIHGLIKGSRYAEIPEAAYFSNFEQSDAFTREMLGFLNT